MDPLTDGIRFAILAAACRFLAHAAAQLYDAYVLIRLPKGRPGRGRGARKLALLLVNAVAPVAASLSSDLHLIDGGTTWAVLEGLAAAAAIAGVHGIGKQRRRKLDADTSASARVASDILSAAVRHGSPYGDARAGQPWETTNTDGGFPDVDRYDVDPDPTPEQLADRGLYPEGYSDSPPNPDEEVSTE